VKANPAAMAARAAICTSRSRSNRTNISAGAAMTLLLEFEHQPGPGHWVRKLKSPPWKATRS
jgi:hypothetical protein